MRGVLTDEVIAALRSQVWELHGYQTHEPEVDRFHSSNAPIKIVSSPARTAKSYSGAYDVLPDIIIHGMAYGMAMAGELKGDWIPETFRGWIVCPNYDLAKEFDYLYRELVERHGKLGPVGGFEWPYKIDRAKRNPNQGDMEIVLSWGENQRGEQVESIIEVRTSANEKSLQSEELDWTILSEAAELDESVWSTYMATRATRAILPTTPKVGAGWLLDMIEQSEDHPELGIDAFSFTVRANPKYKCERFWKAHAKAELSVAGEITTIPIDETKPPSQDNGHDCFDEVTGCQAAKDDGFAEQFLGHWTLKEGRVVPLRERVGPQGQPSHVINFDPKWTYHADLDVAVDYGFSDGTVLGFWLGGPQQVLLRRSIYEKGLTPDDIVDRVQEEKRWFERHYKREFDFRRVIGDPKKPEVAELFSRHGLRVWNIDKKLQADRQAGHLEFMNMLQTDPATGEPSLLVHADNSAVINEWKSLRWNTKVRSETQPTALIGADHAYDMTRYYVNTRPFGLAKIIKINSNENWIELQRARVLEDRRRSARATVASAYATPGRVGGLH